jgi:SNF2 family DNA or RNA helicase
MAYKIRLCSSYPSLADMCLHKDDWQTALMSSGKAQTLADLLPALKQEGRRVLLFSQFTIVLVCFLNKEITMNAVYDT